MYVDEVFLRQLKDGKVDSTKLVGAILPPRPWHKEKLATFLAKLDSQTQQEQE